MEELMQIKLENMRLREQLAVLEGKLLSQEKEIKLIEQVENIASVGHFIIDTQSRQVSLSPGIYRILGLESSNEIETFEKMAEYVYPPDLPMVGEVFNAALNEFKNFETEYRIIRTDKKIRHIHIRGQIIADTGKAFLYGILRDISEFRTIQSQLSDSMERFRALFENAPLGYQSLDINGNFIEVNEAWCSTLGYTKEEVLGRNFSEFIHPDLSEHFKENFPRFKSMGYILGVEFEMVKKDGSIIVVSFDGRIGRDNAGNFKQTHCILNDITAKKIAEDELRESHELNQQIINCANEGIIVYDKNLCYMVWNPYMESMTGMPANKVIGKSPLIVFPFLAGTGLMEHLNGILNGAGSRQLEFECVLPDGQVLWIMDNSSPLRNSKGEITGIIGVVNNNTERKKYEEQLHLNSLVLDQIQDCVTVTDLNGNITYVNQAEVLRMGYSKDEITGKSVRHYGESKNYGASQDTIINETRKHGCWRGEVVNTTKDGSEIIMDCRTTVFYDTNGNPKGMCGISTDVTERIKTESALRESEEKYRLLHENAGIGIGYFSPEGTVISFNQVASRLMNGKPDDFAGKNVLDLFEGDAAKSYFERIQKACESDIPQSYEDFVDLPSSRKWFISTYTRLTDVSGKTLGIQIISQDITELKEQEKTARENENKYRALFNNLAEGVALNEIIYNEKGEMIDYRILEVNDSFYLHADYSAKNVIGRKATEIYGMESIYIKSFWYAHKDSKKSAFTEMFSPLSKKHYYVITSPFENGKFITSFMDITERKQTEEALKLSEEKFRQIVENSNEIFYRQYLEDGKFEYTSPKFETILGYTEYDLQLMGYAEQINFIHPDDIESLASFRRDIIEADTVGINLIEREFRLRSKSGEYKWIQGSYSLVRNDAGEPQLVAGSLRDITQRKTYELRLSELNRLMAKAQEIALLGFGTYGLIDDNVIWSDEVSDIFGFPKGSGAPRFDELKTYVHPDDMEVFIEGINKVTISGQPFHQELRIRRPDGEVRHIIAYIEPSDINCGITSKLFCVMQDITNSKIIEEALLQSEKRFSDIAATIPGAIYQFVMKPDGKIVIPFMSKSAELLFERIIDELMNTENLFKNLHPDDVEGMWLTIRESAEKLSQWKNIFRIRTKANGYKWISGVSIPNKADDGSICWNGVLTDITESKMAEFELMLSRERYQNFLQNAYEGIYLTEFDKPIDTTLPIEVQIDKIYENAYMAECNLALAKMYGFGCPTDFIGRRMIDFHGGVNLDASRAMFRNFIESGYKFHGYENQELADDGKILCFSNNAVGVVENGLLIRIWGTTLDITANKISERILRESEQRYRLFVETANEGICSIDEKSIIVFVNSKMAELLLYSTDELIGMNFDSLIFNNDRQKHKLEMEQRYNGINGFYERKLKRKDGTGIWTYVSSSAIFDEHGSFIGSFGMFTDISHKKEMETDLIEINDLLDSVNEAQSAYIAKGDSRAVFEKLLSILVKLTKSEFGFLDEVLKDEKGTVFKLNLAITDLSWNQESIVLYRQLTERKLEFRNLDNLAGLPAKTGEIIISNNPGKDKRSGGLPNGHPNIRNFMGIPLYFGGDLVGVAGIANSPVEYQEKIADFLRPFLSACSSIIYAFRNEQKRKLLMDNLIESEEKFKSIFMNAPLLIALIKPEDGLYVEVNNEFLRTVGYNKDEIIGKTFEEIGIPGAIEREIIQKFIIGNQDFINFEIPIVTKNGNEIICLFNADLITIGGNKRLLTIAQDITMRKAAEKALGESEEKYKTIFDTAPTVILSIDMNGMIFDCNKKIKNLLYYETYEIIGKTFDDFFLPDNKSDIFYIIQDIASQGFSKNIEYRLVCKNDEVVDVLINATAITGNEGELTGILCFIDDISEFKRINREIEEQKEQLRKLGQYIEMVREEEKSEIAYLIHDDIGQALTIMKLTLKLLQDEITGANSPADDYIAQLYQTIDSTIEKARIISSELRPQILDHLGLIHAIEWQAEEFSKRAKIKCGFTSADGLPEISNFVSLVLFRIMQEILANIARHSQADKVKINLDIIGGNIILEINDNGIGIENDKINDPKSFGLMAIMERVKVIRGSLKIEGRKGEGTFVKIIAPLEAE